MFKDWKSTAQGILMFVAITCVGVDSFIGEYTLIDPASVKVLLAKILLVTALVSGLAHLYLKAITTNADAAAVALALTKPTVPPTVETLAATPKVIQEHL